MKRNLKRGILKQDDTEDDPALIWREDYGVSKKCVLHPKVPAKPKAKDCQNSPWPKLQSTIRKMIVGLFDNRYDITSFIDRHPGGGASR